MFKILNDKTICLTRGDVANIVFAPKLGGEDATLSGSICVETNSVKGGETYGKENLYFP